MSSNKDLRLYGVRTSPRNSPHWQDTASIYNLRPHPVVPNTTRDRDKSQKERRVITDTRNNCRTERSQTNNHKTGTRLRRCRCQRDPETPRRLPRLTRPRCCARVLSIFRLRVHRVRSGPCHDNYRAAPPSEDTHEPVALRLRIGDGRVHVIVQQIRHAGQGEPPIRTGARSSVDDYR